MAIAVVIGLAASAGQRNKSSSKGHIEVQKINEQLDDMRYALKRVIEDEDSVKKELKEKEKQEKQKLEEASRVARPLYGLFRFYVNVFD